LLVASELPDLFFFAFQAFGIEKMSVSTTSLGRGVEILTPGSIPWSHGLFIAVVWSVAAAAIAYLVYRDRRTSGVLGLTVLSHWVLDFIVHLPDLPLFFAESPLLGLGLWGSGPGLIASGVLEVALFAGGAAIYLVARKRAAHENQ
jgi:hypothetical protein